MFYLRFKPAVLLRATLTKTRRMLTITYKYYYKMYDFSILFRLDKNSLNTIGIVITTVGSCLLWYFVAEVTEVNNKGILAGEDVVLTIPSATPALRRRLRINLALTRLGVFLTVFGSVVQVISNHTP